MRRLAWLLLLCLVAQLSVSLLDASEKQKNVTTVSARELPGKLAARLS